MPHVAVKRIYEEPSPDDGQRILVDRVWPRGVARADAALDHWLPEVGPSDGLRRWFGHDADRWDEFRRRYRVELADNPAWAELIDLVADRRSTLLFGARDVAHNQAVALATFLAELDQPD